MRNILILLCMVCTIAIDGCVEDFDLKLSSGEQRLVVDGLISSKPGPYYIRLTLSNVGNMTTSEILYTGKVALAEGATVVISDNTGQIDTLQYVQWNENDYQYDYRFGYFKIIKDEYGNAIDTIVLSDPYYYNKQGFYKTSHLKGTPGHTYFLNVTYQQKEYTSSAYMPPVPIIDSVSYVLKPSEQLGKSDKYFPLLYFKEPQGIKNYYLIQLHDDALAQSYTNSLWQFSILSDTYLKPYVNGLNVSTGYSPRGENFYPVYRPGDSIYVALSSLTKEGYDFYKNLIDQFDNDGGAYKSTPASPPGNISNGGLGFFRAAAFSEGRTYIKYTETYQY